MVFANLSSQGLLPLCPCTAAIPACLGSQSVDAGEVDAGDQVFVLRRAIVQIKLLVGFGGLLG